LIDSIEIVIRLGAATLVGGAIGLNRELRGKPTGVRTLGFVGLGAAVAVMASLDLTASQAIPDLNASSRVIQGILAGIGFLGAGVIVRNAGNHIQGMTTAACIWLTAAIGIVCGLGAWRILFVALPLIFVVLIAGGPLELAIQRRWGKPADDPP